MLRKVFLAYWACCSALVAVPFGYLAAGAHSVSSIALVVFGFLGSVSVIYYAGWIVQKAERHAIGTHGVPRAKPSRTYRVDQDLAVREGDSSRASVESVGLQALVYDTRKPTGT